MATCLFTGEVLDLDTREEHTIQRSLGGRVRSTLVTSSAFNERCGQTIDPFVSALYADVMNTLGPVLPSEARSASEAFELPGAPGLWRSDEQSRLVPCGPTVIARQPGSTRPQTVIGPDFTSMERIIRQLGSPPIQRSEMLPPTTDVIRPRHATIHWAIEVGFLKSLLLTFDHLLQSDANRFTRSPILDSVRGLVRTVVTEFNGSPDIRPLGDVSLGVQCERAKLSLYRRLREEARLTSKPFQHTLIASGNPATRSLDAVFVAFDTDPHAFRLSSDWRDQEFTFVMTNGILHGEEASQAVLLPRGEVLGAPTARRCQRRVYFPVSEADQEHIGQELRDRRDNLYRRAIDYVERNCDWLVQEQLARLARLNPNEDRRLTTAIIRHLLTSFAGRTQTADLSDRFLHLVSGVLDDAAGDEIPANSAENFEPPQGWAYWLARYRACLDALLEPFGLPGHRYLANQQRETRLAPALAG